MAALKTQLPRLESLKHVHIIGVCGTLMGAFAAYLKRTGIRVTGSDQNVYPPMSDVLRQAGVELMTGFRPENLTSEGRPDLVVIGNVISRANPEAAFAIENDFAYSSLPEAMERILLPATRNIVIAGTHGKTTTSCMMSHVLVQGNADPNYFFGGVAHDLPYSFQVASIAKGRPFVLEGDEYDTAFWDKVPKFNHYLPDDVVLTSVEYDHADIYPNFQSLKSAFLGLMDRIRSGGRLIACLDYPVMNEMIERAATRRDLSVITYGNSRDARFRPGNIRADGDYTRFEVLDSGELIEELSIRLPGNHNVINALAVWIEAREFGIDAKTVKAGLESFRGVKRRQEIRGEERGVLVLDDFAHHPTAVRETLRALRLKYPSKRLVAVFEPRSATSRRKVFQQEYVQAFRECDRSFIAAPFDQSKIAEDDQFSSDQLVSDIRRQGGEAEVFSDVDAGVASVANAAQGGDLIAVMSNGGFGGFIPKLLAALKK